MAEKPNNGSEELTRLPGTEGYQRVLPRCKPGRYAIKKFHARGGMGEVWQGEDTDIGRPIALKRLRVERSDQAERFLAEAQITGQLEHPGIVPVHDLGTDDENQPFYIMSFIDGPRLKDAIADYHAPHANGNESREVQRLRLLGAFVKLCQTIAYAHSRGVIHRDLKPDNVMIGPFGETVILDWGLAKIKGRPEEPAPAGYVHLTYGGSSTATQYGTVIGAPPYMAPEEAEGKATEADERTDVYLLGGTLYEILTGRAPHQGSSMDELIEMARTVPAVPPRKVNPQVPRALDAICMRALAHRKQDRYTGAGELAEEVQRYLAGEPVAACPESIAQRGWRWCKRHRQRLGWSATAVLVVGLAVFALSLWHKRSEAQKETHKFRLEADREASQRQQHDEAVKDVKEFRRLADLVYFHSAGIEAPKQSEAPYYNPAKGEKDGQSALDLARKWGTDLGKLPLAEEQDALKREVSALLLLLVQVQLQQRKEDSQVKRLLELLDWARALDGPSRGLHRLRAMCHERLKERELAAEEQKLAAAPGMKLKALDHFLRGEEFRGQSVGPGKATADTPGWQLNRELLEKAIAAFRDALALEPDHYWSHFQMGRCQLSLGQTAQAVLSLGTCVALKPKVAWGYATRGRARIVQGRAHNSKAMRDLEYSEAERDLAVALKLESDFPPALLNRGVLRWYQGRPAGALDDFEKSGLSESAYYRGLLHLDKQEYAQAKEAFDAVIHKKRDGIEYVYLLRARTYFHLNDDRRGLDDLDAYLAGAEFVDTGSARAHELRGTVLRRLLLSKHIPANKLSVALGQFLLAIELGGQTHSLYFELGATLLPNNAEAAKTIAGVIKKLPDKQRKTLAKLAAEQGAPAAVSKSEGLLALWGAVGSFTRGLLKKPGDGRLLNLRGRAYLILKDTRRGREDYEKAAKVETSQPEAERIRAEAHSWLGYQYAEEKAVADAQAEASLAMLNGGKNYLIVHNVACIFAKLGETDPKRAKVHVNTCFEHLHRAVALWEGGTRKGQNEIELIKKEEAFASLKEHPEFRKLIEDGREK
jgi:tRNA A-37 threonylcarbamoyl transferase component Bud32